MLARKTVVAEGGRIEKDDKGRDVFAVAVQVSRPGRLEQSWEPGPVGNSKFTEEEMKKIAPAGRHDKTREKVGAPLLRP